MAGGHVANEPRKLGSAGISARARERHEVGVHNVLLVFVLSRPTCRREATETATQQPAGLVHPPMVVYRRHSSPALAVGVMIGVAVSLGSTWRSRALPHHAWIVGERCDLVDLVQLDLGYL